jgi:site-specific recombinase XerD
MTETSVNGSLEILAPRSADHGWTSAADALIAVVTNRLHSDVPRRGYRSALRQFLAWHLAQGGGPLSRQFIQRYRTMLEGKHLAPSTINQHLSAIRALADECAESGLLDQPTAAAVGRVKGVPVRGVRLGKWLTREQAEQLLSTPPATLMDLRDRAILGLLIGCGLRRDELANLTFSHVGTLGDRRHRRQRAPRAHRAGAGLGQGPC